jgi:GNAT superfamily N-acetyltransferase
MIADGYTDLAAGKIASVVTYLEMTERPVINEMSSTEVELRRIHNADLEWYRAIYRRVGAQWLWFSRLEMTDAQLSEQLARPGNELFVAERSGKEIGMAELDRSNASSGAKDVEITSFGLFPESIGKGFGRPFMQELLNHAWDASTERVWLHTCSFDGPAALSFYIKRGFRPYKRAVEVGDDPRITGILPEYTAPQIPIIR